MRAGRTRYLVVVSRPVKRKKHMQSHPSITSLLQMNFVSTASSHHNTSNFQQQLSTNSHHHQHHNKLLQPCTTTTNTSSLANNQSDELCVSCTNEHQMNKSDSNNSNNNDKNCDTINKNLKTEIQQQQQPQKIPPSTLPLEYTTTSSMTESESSNYFKSDRNVGKQQSCFNCRKNSSLAVELKTKVDNEEEVEESCLLGIDCNEETTVGLVLRVLADTTIRLDGDG